MAEDNNQIQLELGIDDSSIKNSFEKISKEGKKAADNVENSFGKKDIFGADKAIDFKNIIGDIGDSVKNLAGGFGKFGVIAAGAAVGFLAVKEALNLAKEGEKIDQINNSFEVLSARAGIAADVFRDDLVKAAGGLADTEEILKTASLAISELGSNAKQIPQVLDIARQSSIRFGGEVADNFEKLNQAIITGSTKQLRQIGIFVDAQDAVDKFAKANGRAASEVSEFGKRQAVLNAVLEAGAKNAIGLDETNSQVTTSTKRLSVAIGEIGDALAKISQSAFGDVFSSIANGLTDAATAISGIGPESTTQIRRIDQEIAALTANLKVRQDELAENAKRIKDEASGQQGIFDALIFGSGVDPRFLQAKVDGITAQIENLAAKKKSLLDSQQPVAGNENPFDDTQRQKEALDAQKKYKDELLKLEQESNAQLTQLRQSDATLQEQQFIQEQEARAKHLAALDKLERDFANSKFVSKEQYNLLIAQEETRAALEIQKIEAQTQVKLKAQIEAASKAKLAGYSQFFGNLATLMQTGSRELFEIGKVAAVAQATIDGYAAIQGAYKQGTVIGGPALGAAFAAAAGIATAVNIAKIASTNFGDGGGVSVSGAGASNPTGADTLPTQPTESETRQVKPELVVNINGDVLGDEASGRKLIDLMNSAFDTSGVNLREGVV